MATAGRQACRELGRVDASPSAPGCRVAASNRRLEASLFLFCSYFCAFSRCIIEKTGKEAPAAEVVAPPFFLCSAGRFASAPRVSVPAGAAFMFVTGGMELSGRRSGSVWGAWPFFVCAGGRVGKQVGCAELPDAGNRRGEACEDKPKNVLSTCTNSTLCNSVATLGPAKLPAEQLS